MAQAGVLDLARDNIIGVLGLAGPNFIRVLDRERKGKKSLMRINPYKMENS